MGGVEMRYMDTRLTLNPTSFLSFLSAGVTYMCYHTWLSGTIFKRCILFLIMYMWGRVLRGRRAYVHVSASTQGSQMVPDEAGVTGSCESWKLNVELYGLCMSEPSL